MIESLLCITILLLFAVLAMLAMLLRRKTDPDFSAIDRSLERTERTVRDEVAKNREELNGNIRLMSESLHAQHTRLTQTMEQQFSALRKEVAESLKSLSELLANRVGELGSGQRTQLGNIVEQLGRLTESNEKKLEALFEIVATVVAGFADETVKTTAIDHYHNRCRDMYELDVETIERVIGEAREEGRKRAAQPKEEDPPPSKARAKTNRAQ